MMESAKIAKRMRRMRCMNRRMHLMYAFSVFVCSSRMPLNRSAGQHRHHVMQKRPTVGIFPFADGTT